MKHYASVRKGFNGWWIITCVAKTKGKYTNFAQYGKFKTRKVARQVQKELRRLLYVIDELTEEI